MTRPDVAELTDRLYGRLPELYRLGDARQDDGPDGWPLLRWLSLTVDQAAEVDVLADRFDPAVDGTSDLVDPDTAEAAWLPWLGQLVGAKLSPNLTEAETRDAIANPASGWLAGTKPALAAAARTALTGSRYAEVLDHSVTLAEAGEAGVFDVLLVTRTSETPDLAAVLDAVVAKGGKPAGVVLHHEAYEATWETLEATYPTWSDLEGRTWRTIEETLPPS